MADDQTARGARETLRRAGALRDTPRNTLKPSGQPESSAEHSWRLALLALLTCPPGLDRATVLAHCVLHDIAEAVTGDLPASDRPDPVAKTAAERVALDHLLAPLSPEQRAPLRALLDEYEAQATPEARFVKAADRCETVLAHAEADQGPAFDWSFNLDYGKGLADPFPTLAALRRVADEETTALQRNAAWETAALQARGGDQQGD
jgi:putative hydrolase of HD superfamily